MGKSKDLATGETRFVNTSGDSMVNDGEVLKLSRTSGASENLIFSTQAAAGISTTTYVGQIESAGNNALEVFTTGNNSVHIGTNNAVRMTVDGSGRVTKPNQPAWVVYANSRTGWQTTGIQKTPYDTVIHAEPSSAYSTTNRRYTAPVTGRYWVQISQNGISDIILYIYKNGSIYHGGEYRSNPTGSWEHYVIGTVVQLSANDYVEAYVNLGNSGGYGWNGASSSWDHFSGFLIG